MNEGLLAGKSDENSKNKIKPVYFSLTKEAIKQHQFDVLGISAEKENRRKLYHLLFFYQAFSPVKRISNEQLTGMLRCIPSLEKDLVVESLFHYAYTNVTETIYKPVGYIQIRRTELSDVGLPNEESMVLYSCRFLSFSEEEIKDYLEKSKNEVLPFVNSINFRKEEIGKQFRKVFDNLREAHLISLIKDPLFGGTRFIISDDSLRELINRIWIIHEYQLAILRDNMNYVKAPDEVEKKWLEQTFGREEAFRIISDANLKRQTVCKGEKNPKEIVDKIENDIRIVERLKLNVVRKYEKVIQEYGFPIDLIEGICLGKVLQ